MPTIQRFSISATLYAPVGELRRLSEKDVTRAVTKALRALRKDATATAAATERGDANA